MVDASDVGRNAHSGAVSSRDQLCALDGFESPGWVDRPEYRLREPWFLLSGTALRAWLLVSTPGPFKRRNIFTGESALMRV